MKTMKSILAIAVVILGMTAGNQSFALDSKLGVNSVGEAPKRFDGIIFADPSKNASITVCAGTYTGTKKISIVLFEVHGATSTAVILSNVQVYRIHDKIKTLVTGWTGSWQDPQNGSTWDSLYFNSGPISPSNPHYYYITINISPNPTPVVTSNSPITEGQQLNLSCSMTKPDSTYGWSGPNSFSSTAKNPAIPSAVVASSGAYTVTVTDSIGCSGTGSVQVTVNVLCDQAPVITWDGTTLRSSAPTGNQWYYNGNPIGATGQDYVPNLGSPDWSFGNYYVRTVTNCSQNLQSNTIAVSMPTGMSERAASMTRLYPTPAVEYLNVECAGDFVVTVTDMSGRTVISERGSQKSTLDVSGLRAGTYVVIITGENGLAIRDKIAILK